MQSAGRVMMKNTLAAGALLTLHEAVTGAQIFALSPLIVLLLTRST